MTSDVGAIDVLSDQFRKSIGSLPHFDGVSTVILSEGHPIIAQGEKILRMYEAEAEKSPDDPQVKDSMARHLYRMGWLYYEAFDPRWLPGSKLGSSRTDSLTDSCIRNAAAACYYMNKSYKTVPSAGAANVLADIFRLARFYGTAIYWFRKVEEGTDDDEILNQAKAKRLDLEADGKTSDPPLPRRPIFPTRKTAGLVLEYHPETDAIASSSAGPGMKTTSAKISTPGGCVGSVFAATLVGLIVQWTSGFSYWIPAGAILVGAFVRQQLMRL